MQKYELLLDGELICEVGFFSFETHDNPLLRESGGFSGVTLDLHNIPIALSEKLLAQAETLELVADGKRILELTNPACLIEAGPSTAQFVHPVFTGNLHWH
jgi:hypothetical protein